jgi:malonyl-CoA decarboxylase
MTFFNELLQSIADRGRAMIAPGRGSGAGRPFEQLFDALLSGRGEASGVALARDILDRYEAQDEAVRRAALVTMAERFGPEHDRLEKAIAAYREAPDHRTLMELHNASEPRRQELIRRLNLSPNGTLRLVRMREDLLRNLSEEPGLQALDADFQHLFSSWFNRGFLVLRPIDWQTPANILEKIIRYEAVHAIESWDDLRRRLEPVDRRCFAFFHPQVVDEPLIFVEVALTAEIPSAIGPLLTGDRRALSLKDATTAVFYSISNCQDGLRGVSFGRFLIKQVAEELARQVPSLTTFVTLSPVPGFARWLDKERRAETPDFLGPADRSVLDILDDPAWLAEAGESDELRRVLTAAAAHYLLDAKGNGRRPLDPVARFHLGNGARLERIDWLGDPSPRGLAQAYGFMVNYLYALGDIEKNHEAYSNRGEIAASPGVRGLIRRRARKDAVQA